MNEFNYRTEDIPDNKVLEIFVKTSEDKRIIQELKSRNPVVLVGSRGVGKSLLFRVAQAEIKKEDNRTIPVYITFNRASLVRTSDPQQFQHWMLARLCSRILRTIRKLGLISKNNHATSILSGGSDDNSQMKVELIATQFEDSWKNPGGTVDITGLPDMDDFRDAIEDLCEELSIDRFALFFDEAAHIFRPAQQREFFSLFRDLRSPQITCNAAVYPGVTSYGDAFQPVHDATFMTVERDIVSPSYIDNMFEIVLRQSDKRLQEKIRTQKAVFSILAYAASGNPRLLLKTLARTQEKKFGARSTNEVIKDYYRTDMWSEHSGLAGKYVGHRALVDWGRNFLENHVLPEIKIRNEKQLAQGKKTSTYFWVHRDAPSTIVEALRLLAYTGIVTEDKDGIRATRGEVGTRYRINLGCLLALESHPSQTGREISGNLDPRRMLEFGSNHISYEDLLEEVSDFSGLDSSELFKAQLETPVTKLDLTPWQIGKLKELELSTIYEVLRAGEVGLQKAKYIGEKRSRRMWNAANSAILEYLSG